MPEWPTRTLGDVVRNHDSRRVPLSGREREQRRGPYPYYGAAGIIDSVDQPIFSGLHLLVGEDGSVARDDGTPFVQLADDEFWVNNHAHVLTGESDTDTRFVYYALSKTNIRPWVTGAVQPKLNQRNMNQIPIPYPEAGIRRGIVDVLGSLDDKIEQNRRTARALERLARAIFRAWFVDFEPVKAKAAGAASFPSMPQAVFDALPSTFTDSDLGPVPAGWKVRTLGDIFEIGVGGQWGEDEPNEKSTLAARCLRGIDCHELASGALPEVPLRYLKPDLAAKRTLAEGVVLVEGSGSFCGRSFFWRNAYASLFREPVLYTNFTKRLDPRLSVSQSLVGWLHMRDAYDAGGMAAHRTGSAFPNLDLQGLLDTYPLAIPPRQISDSFADTFNALDDPHYIRESRKLAELRDYLLPQLLSGHVPVEVGDA